MIDIVNLRAALKMLMVQSCRPKHISELCRDGILPFYNYILNLKCS